MSEQDLHPDDELVSAYLDGEATEAEALRVEREPELQARLATFHAISEEMAAVDRPPAQDDLVAAAVAAARAAPAPDAPTDDGPTAAGPEAEVIPLARRPRVQLTAVVSIAAAIALLVLVGGALAERWREDADREQYAQVGAAVGAADSVADGSAGDEASPDRTPEAPVESSAGATEENMTSSPTTAPGGFGGDGLELEAVELGSFGTREEAQTAVTAAVDEVLASPDATGDRSGAGLDSMAALMDQACLAGIVDGDDELAALVYTATFALPEGRHQVFLFALVPGGAANGTHRLYEVSLAGCDVISEATISP